MTNTIMAQLRGTIPCFLTMLAVTSARPEDVLRANMDSSIEPGVDFFDYANAGWLRRNPIPASESAWGIGKVVQEELYGKLRKINEQAAAVANPAGSEQQKIADFWTT